MEKKKIVIGVINRGQQEAVRDELIAQARNAGTYTVHSNEHVETTDTFYLLAVTPVNVNLDAALAHLANGFIFDASRILNELARLGEAVKRQVGLPDTIPATEMAPEATESLESEVPAETGSNSTPGEEGPKTDEI